tara:strand:+ start:608 stop:1348 length:741 start_codon:yes stop_codon:yes gene_type:complete
MDPLGHVRGAKNTAKQIAEMAAGVFARVGPYHKEGLYQDMLCHELSIKGLRPVKECVQSIKYKDSTGKTITIGNNQSARTDIEFHDEFMKTILELKSTKKKIDSDMLYQLKHYLDGREDRDWGMLINFISNEKVEGGKGRNTGVECYFIHKTETYIPSGYGAKTRTYICEDVSHNLLGEYPSMQTIFKWACDGEPDVLAEKPKMNSSPISRNNFESPEYVDALLGRRLDRVPSDMTAIPTSSYGKR